MKWGLVSLVFLLVTGTGCFFVVYHSLHSASKDMHSPIDRDVSAKRDDQVSFDEKDPFSVLLLGIDEREGDAGRSDTMIVLTVNPDKKKTTLLSIPRDTYAEISGRGDKNKINHAYAYGGVKMAMETVEHMLDIPLDYYIKVNMEGFEDMIDVLGGVKVTNSLAFESGGYRFPVGDLVLNGKQALSYTRMRQDDPDGDFGRQERQREIIQSVLRQGSSLSTILNTGDILQSLGENVKTNLTFNQLIDIQNDYRQAADHIEQISLDAGTNKYINGIYFYVIPEETIAAVQKVLRGELELY
ncbi:LCP family protein [Jeotgalibacillus sp. S-D1]|uniref:LCP family glycopolymer transferase n=1 Tax=Jeotgalibacillus sp. S-D1 TaxID=2552189 RepID=UPI001F0CEDDE|nr:LCP family protein [Jeotgalibacillus sp. S-D1]